VRVLRSFISVTKIRKFHGLCDGLPRDRKFLADFNEWLGSFVFVVVVGLVELFALFNRYRSKHKAFTRYSARISAEGNKDVEQELARMKKYCSTIRVLAHTQIRKIGLRQKKAHLMEIQINGGSVVDKVNWGFSLFERKVPVDSVFSHNDMIDVIGITKGHGYKGVVSRWGVTRLPRKTHRGNRKVRWFAN